jgi:hypothetical protein
MNIEDGGCCIVKGCAGIACYGFGTVRKGSIRFACRDHRHLIWSDDKSKSPGQSKFHVRQQPKVDAQQRSLL